MRFLVTIVGLAAGLGAAVYFSPLKNKVSLPAISGSTISLPKVSNLFPDKEQEETNPTDKGKGIVAGLSTVVSAGLKTLPAVGTQVTQAVSNTLTKPPSEPSDIIDVGKVTNQIASQVEQIPSSVLSQAKIAYCQQVLLQATASATPTP